MKVQLMKPDKLLCSIFLLVRQVLFGLDHAQAMHTIDSKMCWS